MATLENREDLVTESMGPRFPHHKPMISMIAGTGHKLNDLNKFPGSKGKQPLHETIEEANLSHAHHDSIVCYCIHIANAMINQHSYFLREALNKQNLIVLHQSNLDQLIDVTESAGGVTIDY